MKKQKTILSVILIIFCTFNFISCTKNSIESENSNVELFYKSSNSMFPQPFDSTYIDTVKILAKNFKILSRFNENNTVELRKDKMVLYFTLNNSIRTIGLANLPENTYNNLEFEIYKLSRFENIPDSDFRDSINTYSVILKGKFLGKRFTYKSSINTFIKKYFSSEIIVNDNKFHKLLLYYSPFSISIFKSNGRILNPTEPSDFNIIDSNIAGSINSNFKIEKLED